MPVFGPGVLQIGDVASAIDVSCLINGARIVASKDQGDPTTKLCGTVRPGHLSYTWALSGNMDIDPDDPDGIFLLTQTAFGTEVPFTFTPNSATELTATGVLILDPLDFGADAYGDDMTSDFEFSLVDKPTYAVPAPPPLDDAAADDGAELVDVA